MRPPGDLPQASTRNHGETHLNAPRRRRTPNCIKGISLFITSSPTASSPNKLASRPGVVHYPPRKHRRPILFRGVSGNHPTFRGGEDIIEIGGFPPFPGILERTNLIFIYLAPLQYPLLYTSCFTHIFYSWLSCQIYSSHPFRGSGDRWVTRDCASVNHCAR